MRTEAHPSKKPSAKSGLLAALAACALAFLLPAPASAAPPQLWQKCDSDEPAGQQCSVPRGIAADPDNGHVFVADQGNDRIVEYNALGQFVKTWGWDVVQGGGSGFEICVPSNGDTCKAGSEGAGNGQFAAPQGIALDSSGDVYVVDVLNRRVEKFDPKGNFVLMFGGKVNKTEVEAAAPEAQQNLCTAASGDVCQAGVEGTGNGQFGTWKIGSFIAVDPTDKVYVGDRERIQRFDTDGVYQGQISLPGETVKGLTTDASGDLYAIYDGKPDVRKITAGGVELASPRFAIPEPDPVTHPLPTAVAVDAAGHVYAFSSAEVGINFVPLDPIFEFDAAGKVIDQFGKKEFNGSTGLATNLCAGNEAPGDLYVTNIPSFGVTESFLRAYGTAPFACFKARTGQASNLTDLTATLNGTVNPDGATTSECRFEYGTSDEYGATAPCAESPIEIGEGSTPVPVHADIGGLEKGTVYHFRPIAKVGGETETGADEQFKTLGPPLIGAEHLVSATDHEATLKALVNPEGFSTSYRFQYTTEADFEANGFEAAKDTVTIAIGSADRKDHPVLANLEGLAAGTAYRWRAIATNSSGTSQSEGHLFTTYRPFLADTSCPNQVFRTAEAAFLPDCRAYEMVSPVDKNGGDIVSLPESGYYQATPDGDKLTYTAMPSFGDEPNAFANNQYLATRQDGAGWSNHGIHPPVVGGKVRNVVFGLLPEFMAFSPDLCSAWLVDFQTPAPTADGQPGTRNLYRRDNCAPGEGGLEAMTPFPPALPEAATNQGFIYADYTSVQGVSEDSRHAVFVAQAQLTPEASAALDRNFPVPQVYDRFQGVLSLVSVLPDGAAGDPAPGDGQGFADPSGSEVGSNWYISLAHAVSVDGSRVYWTSGIDKLGNGAIYLRLHPEQGIVAGECEAANACTVPVSPGEALFWAASRDGSRALFSEGNLEGEGGTADLYEFDLQRAEEGEAPKLLAEDIRGVAGQSEDLSRVYFVSRTALPEAGQNSEGDEAVAGQPNLYLATEGGFGFVATLVAGDVGAKEPGGPLIPYWLDGGGEPSLRATRVSADGNRLTFESRARLSDYDNAEATSGKPAVEVYLYDAGSNRLACVSCNPSGARPEGRELAQAYNQTDPRPTKVTAAAWIPTRQQPLHAVNVLSEDGRRLFFNSYDALLPRDTNGAQDVYEWESPGTGGCTEAGSSYLPQSGGCLYLISSGQSPQESEFWEADADGSDAFFTTESSFLPRDPGSIDLYDARIGGGLPEPPTKAACEAEACQPPVVPPNDPTPASSTFRGQGSPAQGAGKPRCPKGKRQVRRKGKARCLARAKGQKHRQSKANHSRRQAR